MPFQLKGGRVKKSLWKKQLLVDKDLFLIQFQQALSEFSKCRVRKKFLTRKKIPVENSQKKSRSRIHKKNPGREFTKRNPSGEFTKKIPFMISKKNPGRKFTKKNPGREFSKKESRSRNFSPTLMWIVCQNPIRSV